MSCSATRLLDSLTPFETAAVFGHEIGHVAHRHFLYFALFFMGSLGLLSLCGDGLAVAGSLIAESSWLSAKNAAFWANWSRVADSCSAWRFTSGLSSATSRGGLSARPTSMEARLSLATDRLPAPHRFGQRA